MDLTVSLDWALIEWPANKIRQDYDAAKMCTILRELAEFGKVHQRNGLRSSSSTNRWSIDECYPDKASSHMWLCNQNQSDDTALLSVKNLCSIMIQTKRENRKKNYLPSNWLINTKVKLNATTGIEIDVEVTTGKVVNTIQIKIKSASDLSESKSS